MRNLEKCPALIHASQFRVLKPSREASKQKAGTASNIDDAQPRRRMPCGESPEFTSPQAVLEASE
jgi:hypothetical protein